MEERSDKKTMLELMLQPAFLVEEGVICHVNSAAAAYLLEAGGPVAPMIACGSEEYAQFQGGQLYLTLSIGGQTVGASVTRMEGGDIFTLEQPSEAPQLQTLALAAMELREPLSGIVNLAYRILPELAKQDEVQQKNASQMNRRLYQLQRIVGNMADAAAYSVPHQEPMEYMEICGFLEEILEKTATLAQQSGLRLEYEVPREMVYTLANSEKLERAAYNMLSNAMKYAPEGSVIQAKLICKNRRLYFSVTNPGDVPRVNLYTRFLRQPALEDPRNGVGLGMVIIRAAAITHGGAVLIDQVDDATRVTLTMQVRQSGASNVRSTIMRIDYTGERDHALTELADVLPASVYGIENES